MKKKIYIYVFNYIKNKSFCSAEKQHKGNGNTNRGMREDTATHVSLKGLQSTVHKEFSQLGKKKAGGLIEKTAKDLNWLFTKE